VGGWRRTTLPRKRKSLEVMDCSSPEDVGKFAEVCCASWAVG